MFGPKGGDHHRPVLISGGVLNTRLATVIETKLEVAGPVESERRPSLLANVMGCFGGSNSRNDSAEEDRKRKEANKRIEKQIQKDKQIYRATHRLLLLGQYYLSYVTCHILMMTCPSIL